MVSVDGGKADVQKCKEEMLKMMSSWASKLYHK